MPYVFAEFQRVIGESHWLKRVKILKEEIRGQPYLHEFIHEHNELAFSLAACSELAANNNGMLPLYATNDRNLYSAFAFMAQTLSIIKTSAQVNADEFTKRIRGGLKNPPDLRAMKLELHAANHFVSRGHAVEWPEMSKTGTFDLLVSDLGSTGLEVECKSISSDKGRRIHRRDALDFFHFVRPQIEAATKTVVAALSVVLTVPSRLPSSIAEKRKLAKMVVSTLLQGKSQQFAGGVNVRISEFDPAELPVTRSHGRLTVPRELVDRVTSTINREAMIIGTPRRGMVVVVVQSATDDEMLKAVFDTVADSAKRQLTGQRAGLFFIGFEDITSAQLIDLAEHDGAPGNHTTALRRAVSKFLSNAERDHVVGVNFLSCSALEEINTNTVTSRGSAYYFPRKESKFWHDHYEGFVRIT